MNKNPERSKDFYRNIRILISEYRGLLVEWLKRINYYFNEISKCKCWNTFASNCTFYHATILSTSWFHLLHGVDVRQSRAPRLFLCSFNEVIRSPAALLSNSGGSSLERPSSVSFFAFNATKHPSSRGWLLLDSHSRSRLWLRERLLQAIEHPSWRANLHAC